jgi:hypothetical protein
VSAKFEYRPEYRSGQRVKKEEFLNFTSFLITCLNIPLLNLKQH